MDNYTRRYKLYLEAGGQKNKPTHFMMFIRENIADYGKSIDAKKDSVISWKYHFTSVQMSKFDDFLEDKINNGYTFNGDDKEKEIMEKW